jgi:phosphoenolpyruvate-protein phosphotransferase (PTS system enzyme I)
MSFQVFGIPVTRGVAIGKAVLVSTGRVDVAHYFVEEPAVEPEVQRCLAACESVGAELDALRQALPGDAPPELDALLEVHQMLVRDPVFIGGASQWIRERRYNAEWALSAQLEVLGRQFDDMEDDYLRERKSDLEQVVSRVLTVLSRGGDDTDNEPLLLVAADISPADLMGFRQGVFKGFITDTGGRTSHTAIVARSMGIPAVVGTREASRLIRQDDWIVIDGDQGVVIVDPSPIVLDEYRFRQRQAELERARLTRLKGKPAVTLDGERVEMLANIELPSDAVAALDAGAEGVGLFRTEFLFMNRGAQLPGEDEQYEAYRDAVLALDGRPLTIRTVDIGADKPLERGGHEAVLNPALGLRAIRWSLSEPSLLRHQLRAALRASRHGPVRILLPMVAHPRELRAVYEAMQAARAALAADPAALPLPMVPLGVMVEVPAAALVLPRLLPWVQFVSIGTNDLIQYTLAIDRADQAVSHLYDPWHPAVLQLIARVIAEARTAGKDVCVCGEMAGDPLFTAVLLGFGLRSFSMHPSQLSLVKQAILRSDSQRAKSLASEILGADEPQRLAAELKLTH